MSENSPAVYGEAFPTYHHGLQHDGGHDGAGGRAWYTIEVDGVQDGAMDAAQGVAHEVRAGHSDRQPDDRAAAAHARWHAGLPARNTFERDAYAAIETRCQRAPRWG